MSLRSTINDASLNSTPSKQELIRFFAQGLAAFADSSLKAALDAAIDGTNISEQQLWLVLAKAAASMGDGDVAKTFTALTVGTLTVNTSEAVTPADGLTVGGVIVPQHIEVSFHAQGAAAQVDQSFFIANRAYQVVAIKEVHAVAEATAVSLAIQVTKDTATDAPGAGTDLLTNNTNAGFDGKATANTVQSGTLTATAASLQLAAGDRLSVDFSAAATELVGVTITVTLKRI